MLNLALVGLLTGSLVTGVTPDGDRGGDKPNTTATQADAPSQARVGLVSPEVPAVLLDDPTNPRTIIADTYSAGRSADESFLKLWAEFGYGEVDGEYNRQGERSGVYQFYNTEGEIQASRINVGAQINFLNFSNLHLGGGAQLTVAQNRFDANDGATGEYADGAGSSFGLQNVKVYGQLRGSAAGVHAGYIFDLGSQPTYGASQTGIPIPVPDGVPVSDDRDAFFVGADFDYPSQMIRLFGGIDYYMLYDDPDVVPGVPGSTYDTGEANNDDIIHFTTGLGLRFRIIEIGAALHVRARMSTGPDNSLTAVNGLPAYNVNGGHSSSISPYVRLSPGFIPASIYIRGGLIDEYDEYGYSLDGSNDIKPGLGFTAGLSYGFN